MKTYHKSNLGSANQYGTKHPDDDSAKYYYETDGGSSGYIDASSIDEARQKFAEMFPDVRPDRAGVWAPTDPEYPDER